MTHEELLAKIDKPLNKVFANHQEVKDLQVALRAVVELHKPKDFYGAQVCDGCDTKLNWQIDYPCSTIQAIEKELR